MKKTLALATLVLAGFTTPALFAADVSSTPPANSAVEQKLNALQQQMVELQAAMNKLNQTMGSANTEKPMVGMQGGMMGHMMGGMGPEAMKQHCESMMSGMTKPEEVTK